MDTIRHHFRLGVPSVGAPYKLIANFARTRSVIKNPTVTPAGPGLTATMLGDSAVEVLGRPSNVFDEIVLTVDVLGESVTIEDTFLLQSQEAAVSAMNGGEEVAPDPHLRLKEASAKERATTSLLARIQERRAKVQGNDRPLNPHRRFFLDMDEWTDLRCLTRPPDSARLPNHIDVPDAPIVLEALNETTLVDELTRWVKALATTGTAIPLANRGNTTYSPHQWVIAMSPYLKQVLEIAFCRSFQGHIITTDNAIHPEFQRAFEQFANGNLGELNRKGKPESSILFPNSAYYFCFAAFAWVAKGLTGGNEKQFWETVWPVWAYTAEIYRRRFTPAHNGGSFSQYNLLHFNPAVSDQKIISLRKTIVEPSQLYATLKLAFNGNPG